MSLRCICTSLLFLLATLAGTAHADTFEKALMPGELSQAHAKYESDCKNCHAKFDKTLQTRLCLDCHKDINADVSSKQHMHGQLADTTCRNCHTEHKGRDAHLAILDKSKFDHAVTGFRLTGAHQPGHGSTIDCASCHRSGARYRDAPVTCVACHAKDDQTNGHKGSLGKQCQDCHNDRTWKDARFDHEKTRFPLAGGKHADVKCTDCHQNRIYNTAPLDCNGCHRKDDQDKGHKGRYGTQCATCHVDRGWKEIRFNHDTDTHYALKARHRQVSCDSCHVPELGQLYHSKISQQCVACHKKDDQEKGHHGELGEKCATCHNERGWKSANFDHDETHFPLRDKHRSIKCEACHVGGVSGDKASKLKLERSCVACHIKDDRERGHKGRYGDRCETCHSAKTWRDITFDHNRDTDYPLRSSHQQVKCDACHLPAKGALYHPGNAGLDRQCVACHLKDDRHKNQLGSRCETCHNESTWHDAPYDHNKARFVLTGSHLHTDCKKCHLTPEFGNAPMDCYACHAHDDVHKKHYGTRCDSCHYTGTWSTWDFDHATTTFRLDGAHADVACATCHRPEGPVKIGKLCISCHQRDDAHHGAYGVQCQQCHATTDWKKATIRR